jgi:hypothetical protein
MVTLEGGEGSMDREWTKSTAKWYTAFYKISWTSSEEQEFTSEGNAYVGAKSFALARLPSQRRS